MSRFLFFVTTLTALLDGRPASPCTTLCMSRGKQVVVAKSYDFDVGHGLLVLNRRGVAKQAIILVPGGRPARWDARYASVSFNQYGRELPLGGMNERGLVVEIMWLTGTRHPPLERGRETVNELQLIQYLLDRCATVQEAIAAVKRLQVAKAYAAVHYMVCDRQGACVTVEHLAGKLVLHTGRRLPHRVLTNHPYAASLRNLRRHRGFGGKLPVPDGRGSLERFARAATRSRSARTGQASLVTLAFAALDDVQQGAFTKWQIAYEPDHGRVHFRPPGDSAPTTVTLEAHGCDRPVQVMDLLGTLSQRPRVLVPYTLELNRRLVRRSFKELGANSGPRAPAGPSGMKPRSFPPQALDLLARYPETTTCTAGAEKAAQEGELLAALETYRKAMIARDARALVAMVHPRYADDAGTPSPADDIDRDAVVRQIKDRLKQVTAVRYRIERPSISWETPERASVDTQIEASYQLGGRWLRHADRNRFVLQRHDGRWLFVRGM